MKNRYLRVAVSALALFAASVACAQSSGVLHVSIPFSFVVNGQKMAAGDYTVEQSGEAGLLILHCFQNRQSAIVMSAPSYERAADHPPGLSFERRSGEVHLVRVTELEGPSRTLPVHLQ